MSERPNDTTMLVPAARQVPKTHSGWIMGLLLAALSPVLIAGAFTSGYLPDDQASLAANPIAQSIDLSKALHETFVATGPHANGPLAQLTLGLQYRATGEHAWTLRLVSLLLHVASAWLLYGLILKLIPRGASPCVAEEPINADAPFNTKRHMVAVFGALFFFLHPLCVDAVASVAHRGVVQAVFFAILSCWFLVRHGADRVAWRRLRPPKSRAYLLALVCLMLAVLSCPLFCGWAVVLLLIELIWVRDERPGRWMRVSGLIVAGGLCAWISSSHWASGLPGRISGDASLELLTAAGRGVLNIIAPTGLSAVYETARVDGVSDPRVWVAVGLLAASVVFPLWLPLGGRAYTTLVPGACCVVLPPLLSLTPRASALPNEALYLVLPLAGIFFGLAAEAIQYRLRFIGRESGKIGETVSFGLVVFLFLLMGLLSVARSFVFGSEEELMRDAVNRQPHSYQANLRLAEELSRQARAAGRATDQVAFTQWLEAREYVDRTRFAIDRKLFEDPGRQYLLEGEVEYRLGIEGGKEKIRIAVPLLKDGDGLSDRARALMLEIDSLDKPSVPASDVAPDGPGEQAPLNP